MYASVRRIALNLLALFGAGAVLLFIVAADGLCGSDRVLPARSPGGTYTVLVETSGCGATTVNSTRIALTKANWLHSEHDLFTIEPSWAASVWQGAAAPVRFHWPDDSTLIVEYLPTAVPPARPSRVLDVAVRYVPVAR